VVEPGIQRLVSLESTAARISDTAGRTFVTAPLVEAAASIGHALCAAAYWHEGRCNWIGRTANEAADPSMPLTPTVAALGPELYGGTAGVGIFLAQLDARTAHSAFRDTATGAIRQALSKSDSTPPQMAHSFYSGSIGIAYTAARIGQLLAEDTLVAEGLALARRAVAIDGDHLLDVIGGHAGAIAPLLWLASLPGGAELESTVVAFAEGLVAAAITADEVWRWDNDRACGAGVGTTPLCGYAHGASGMGLALIEAGVRFDRDDFIAGGLAAFRYEDGLYDEAQGNWPDLRSVRGDPSSPRRSFMVAWCHGAAGIGLARLRALRLLPTRRAVLEVGVQRAVRSTAAAFAEVPEQADASPCHGRAGLAETLLYAGDVLRKRSLAASVARRWSSAALAHVNPGSWPCGVASGVNNPSLMLGFAGIGYSLLRADRPGETPSLLVIDPADH
jgi:lantibiotic modifying enzyme